MDKKLVYIAHPVGGDVEGNVKRILGICREIHTETPNVIPFAPYLVALQYLKDNVPEERGLGIDANYECFRRRVMDEIWIYGNKVSNGMRAEIQLAIKNNIPLVCKNPTLEEEVNRLINELKQS